MARTIANGRRLGRTTKALISANMVVRRHRISYQTLNYYTNLGLLPVAAREGNQRLYRANEVRENLEKIRRLKGEGYPLGLISRVLMGGQRGTARRHVAV